MASRTRKLDEALSENQGTEDEGWREMDLARQFVEGATRQLIEWLRALEAHARPATASGQPNPPLDATKIELPLATACRPDHVAHLQAARRLIHGLLDLAPEDATEAELAYAEQATLLYLQDRFGVPNEDEDEPEGWPRDWHECPEAWEFYKQKIMEHRAAEAAGELSAAEESAATDPAVTQADQQAPAGQAPSVGEPAGATPEADATGLVTDPSDAKAYVPACKIVREHWPVPPLEKVRNRNKALWKILGEHPEIWRRQPVGGKYKLMVHLGRWSSFLDAESDRLGKGLKAIAAKGHWMCRKCRNVFIPPPDGESCPQCKSQDITPVIPRPGK
jgi:hypothetical protein